MKFLNHYTIARGYQRINTQIVEAMEKILSLVCLDY
jgi:hypothetical protein